MPASLPPVLCFSLALPLPLRPFLATLTVHNARDPAPYRTARARAMSMATAGKPMSLPPPPLVIGLNQYSHDASIAVVDALTGHVLFALSKERLTRRKHDAGHVATLVPHALSAIATEHNVDFDAVCKSVHLVVSNNHHFRVAPFEQRLRFQHALGYVPTAYLSRWNLIGASVPFVDRPVAPQASKIELSHHLAHVFSAIRDAPFDRGLFVVMDGMGDALDDWLRACDEREKGTPQNHFSEISLSSDICRDSTNFREFPSDVSTRPGVSFREAESAYIFERNEDDSALFRLERIYKRWTPEVAPSELTNHSFEEMHSVGAMYSRISSIIFNDWNACGKVMGLAPYGSQKADASRQERYFMHGDLIDGSLDMKPGQREALEHLGKNFPASENDPVLRTHFERIAYEVQSDLQKVVVDFVTALVEETGVADVAFVGGVALNSCVNGLLADSKAVRTLYVPPYPGDEGIAIGCASFGAMLSRQREATVVSEYLATARAGMPFFGRLYQDRDVTDALDHFDPWITWERVDGARHAGEALADGRIVAWFDGRSEFGPRALGHRSLLADPRREESRTRLNDLVKRREGYRPFAPAVFADQAARFFHGCEHVCCRFMSMTRAVGATDQLAGVVHVDGSARVQTVDRGGTDTFARVIEAFEKKSGVGVVLNTSFNLGGEPIVESPFDAVRTLLKADAIDMLAFENVVVKKREWGKVELSDFVSTGCRSFRSTQTQDSFGECVNTSVTFVPNWQVEGESWDEEEVAEIEETVELMDGLEVEILEMIQGPGGCHVGDIVKSYSGDGDSEEGPTESDILERILDLNDKLLVYKMV